MESIAQIAVLAGTLVLMLMLIAFGGFIYKSLRGDGITWPDETEQMTDDETVRRGDNDDEWEYY